MAKETFSRETYVHVERATRSEGGTTAEAERRQQRGEGLDPNVDPKTNSGLRESRPRFEEGGKGLILQGPPMLVETRGDTTSSMGDNVDRMFAALPKIYDLLASGQRAVLGRYDVQIINGVFNDRNDPVIMCRSQAEMGVKIAQQLTKMVPVRRGGDFPEDPQYGIFAAAYLTSHALFTRWGLKGYDFTVSDASGRDQILKRHLEDIFGEGVYDAAKGNGHPINPAKIPSTKQAFADLLKRAHAFFLQVEGHGETTDFWARICGRDRVVKLPSTDLLPQVQAAIIGLTEGVLTLSTLDAFLREEGELSKRSADAVVRAVSGIPVGAQAKLPGFADIPKRGDVFASKTDAWPIGHAKGPKGDGKPKGNKRKESAGAWL